MKRFINYLYMRFVYLPEFKKRVKEEYGPSATVKLTKILDQDPIQVRQAERERKWISDDELH